MKPSNYLLIFGFLICLTTGLSGCSPITQHPVIKSRYDLTVSREGQTSVHMDTGQFLLIRQFEVAPIFDSHSFVYKVTDETYITDYYNEFISYPAKLITEKFRESFFGSQYFKSGHSRLKKDIAYRLSGKIIHLYADLRNPDSPGTVMKIRIILEKNTGSAFEQLFYKTYSAEHKIPAENPADIISGWNSGLSGIMKKVLADAAKASR